VCAFLVHTPAKRYAGCAPFWRKKTTIKRLIDRYFNLLTVAGKRLQFKYTLYFLEFQDTRKIFLSTENRILKTFPDFPDFALVFWYG
jgi:hypothetical protein